MVRTVRRKVRGGKLLQVRLDHDHRVITSVSITGDFFIHPEEGLDLIEAGLVGASVQDGEVKMALHIEAVIAENRLTVLGFGPRDLAGAVQEALS